MDYQYSSSQNSGISCGFTLVEMAVVLVIISSLLAVSLSVGQAQLKVADIKSTRQNLDVVSDALALFQRKRGRFPCPATYTEIKGNPGYGYETDHTANCTGATEGSNAYVGFVPFRTLGLPESLAYDAWGNRLTYAVDKGHITSSEYADGSLEIYDANGNLITSSSRLGKAIFAVISHGEDEKGAYNASGTLATACGTTAADDNNCTLPASSADPFTITAAPVNDASATNTPSYYNDWVLWKGQENIEPPEFILADTSIVHHLFVTGNNTCIITDLNELKCAGDDGEILGDGTGTQTSIFSKWASDFGDWTMISQGDSSTGCGIRNNNRAYCWGSGELGNGITNTSNYPREINGSHTDWTYISADWSVGCGIRNNGNIYCWGDNSQGQLGNAGATGNSMTPVTIAAGFNNNQWTYVMTAATSVYAIDNDGNAHAWGEDSAGRLGIGGLGNQTQPYPLAGGIRDWEMIHSASSSACGIAERGKLYCWGDNGSGELGLNDKINRDTPERVGTFNDWKYVWSGSNATCGIRSAGILYCWGQNNNGQLGDSTTNERLVPTPVATGITDWDKVATRGEKHTCATRKNGDLYCWGLNDNGQFGNSSTSGTPVTTPQLITGVKVKVN